MVFEQVWHKPHCTVLKLEISDLRRRGVCTVHVVKTKAQISSAVTAKLICAFVFAYAKCLFSHDATHISNKRYNIVTFAISELLHAYSPYKW